MANPIGKTDFTVYYPFQFYQTTDLATQAKNPAYNLVGVGGIFAVQLTSSFAPFFEFEANVNTINGARVFIGPSAGFRYYLFGTSAYHSASGNDSLINERIYRFGLLASLAQRSFDFRSLVVNEGTKDITNKVEGDFWAYQGGISFEYFMSSGLRPGILFKYLQSTKSSNSYLSIASMEVALTLDFTVASGIGN